MRRPYPVQFSPRALRFFVLALAWLQLVAPTWHVCEMGGHLAGRTARAHHGAAPVAPIAANTPLICFCPAPLKPLDPKTPRLDGVHHSNHATCLAMLLQAMPGQLSAPPLILVSQPIVVRSLEIAARRAPRLAAPRRFPARAPPRWC